MTVDSQFSVSEEYLFEVQKRLNAATPGPWCHRDQFIETVDEPGVLLGVTMQRNEEGLDHLPGYHNACFIAHAREDVAYLLAEVGRLRGLVKKLEEQVAAES